MIEHRLECAKVYLKDAFELYKKEASIVQHQEHIMHHIKLCGQLLEILRAKKFGNILGL